MTTGGPAARGRRDPPQPQFRPTTRKAVRNRPGRLSDRPRSRPGPAGKRVPTPPSGPLPSPLPNPPLVVTGAPKTAGGPIRDLKAVPGAGRGRGIASDSKQRARSSPGGSLFFPRGRGRRPPWTLLRQRGHSESSSVRWQGRGLPGLREAAANPRCGALDEPRLDPARPGLMSRGSEAPRESSVRVRDRLDQRSWATKDAGTIHRSATFTDQRRWMCRHSAQAGR